MENSFIMALLAGIGIILAAGPLGCFIVWRQMAFFGETIAHASLLGVALALLLDVNIMLGVGFITVMVAVLLNVLGGQRQIATDTLLGVVAHAMLSFGLIAATLLSGVEIDLMDYLIGDIMSVSRLDLLMVYAIAALVVAGLAFIWKPLLAASVHEELAIAEGIGVKRHRIILILLIALSIAAAMKIVGILLIASFLIIPGAIARLFARSPEQMAVMAVIAGLAGLAAGLGGAAGLGLPTGPAIVAVLAVMFMLCFAAISINRGFARK